MTTSTTKPTALFAAGDTVWIETTASWKHFQIPIKLKGVVLSSDICEAVYPMGTWEKKYRVEVKVDEHATRSRSTFDEQQLSHRDLKP